MTIYDSKEDVIETILPQSGFLALGLLMITEYLITSVFVMWQSSHGVSQSWCNVLMDVVIYFLNFLIT